MINASWISYSVNKEPRWISQQPEVIYLDARKIKEHTISHLSNAHWVGEKGKDAHLYIKDKKSLVVVYCTTGYRSGLVANTWRKKGYTNVFNLAGGVFNWVKNDLKVYSNNQSTFYLHTYDYLRSWLLPTGYIGVLK